MKPTTKWKGIFNFDEVRRSRLLISLAFALNLVPLNLLIATLLMILIPEPWLGVSADCEIGQTICFGAKLSRSYQFLAILVGVAAIYGVVFPQRVLTHMKIESNTKH